MEPLVWESTTVCYTRFITDRRYRKLRPTYQRWYRPVCQKCFSASADAATQYVQQPVSISAKANR